MIYREFLISGSVHAAMAYEYCREMFGPQVSNNYVVWECKSVATGALFYIYREEDAAMFMLKYGSTNNR